MIDTETYEKTFPGNGTVAAFEFPYKYLAKADLRVRHVDSAGVKTLLVLDTDYSLEDAGDEAGGTVVFPLSTSAYPKLPSGESLEVTRKPLALQEIDFVNGGPYDAEEIEDALDRIVTLVAYLKGVASSYFEDLGDTAAAGYFLRFNDAADGLEAVSAVEQGAITLPLSVANGGTNATSVATARTSLGVANTVAFKGQDTAPSSITATGSNAIAAADGASATGANAVALGGTATASASAATAVGEGSTASASTSTALGSNAKAEGVQSVAMGSQSKATQIGVQAFGTFTDSTAYHQHLRWALGAVTSDATTTALAGQLFGSASPMVITQNTAWHFEALVVGRDTSSGDCKMVKVTGGCSRDTGNIGLVGSVTASTVVEDAGASAWTVTATVDTGTQSLDIDVTGAVSTTIQWTAAVTVAEVKPLA